MTTTPTRFFPDTFFPFATVALFGVLCFRANPTFHGLLALFFAYAALHVVALTFPAAAVDAANPVDAPDWRLRRFLHGIMGTYVTPTRGPERPWHVVQALIFTAVGLFFMRSDSGDDVYWIATSALLLIALVIQSFLWLAEWRWWRREIATIRAKLQVEGLE